MYQRAWNIWVPYVKGKVVAIGLLADAEAGQEVTKMDLARGRKLAEDFVVDTFVSDRQLQPRALTGT